MSAFVSVSDDLVFHLGNGHISYVFQASQEGILEHLHFGQAVSLTGQLPRKPRRLHRSCSLFFQDVPYYNLNDVNQECPVFGTSDYRQPAIHILNADGNTIQVFKYQSYELLNAKPSLESLPSARAINEQDSASIKVVLVDEVSQLSLELNYTIYTHHNVISRSARIRNFGDNTVALKSFMSSCLDLPAGDYDLLHLQGSYGRELHQDRLALPKGRFTIDSANGVSGNAHNPFLVVMAKDTSEWHGHAFGTSLLYSGNFSISTEVNEFDSVRILAGINPFNFSWQLEPQQSFTTPESLQVFSDQGLNGMSQTWHAFIREHISPPAFSNMPRPSYLSSWEAAYFDINENKVLELADRANRLGLEMLVIDDGWFLGRNDDTSSLGDWTSDPNKFPNGITQLAGIVKAKGLKFGLWIEPEMVSERSQLFESKPDWIIQVPNRKLSTRRNQFVLDLTRHEVQDYLFDRLDDILSCGDIDYIKWDMNRSMSELGSAALPADHQQETAHRYMLGLYALLERITQAHPHVLFENCAAGGNRFDLGMLRYMSQSWLSDMSEPIGRLPIFNGASFLYPPSVMSSYICPVPNHLNGRMVSLDTRADIGFFCAARGVSLSESDVDTDLNDLKEVISNYNNTAPDLVTGRFYRLKYTDNEVYWQLNSLDGARVYLLYVHILASVNSPFPHIKMVDLDKRKNYQLLDNQEIYSGDALMHMGIDLPYSSAIQEPHGDFLPKGDFVSRLLVFTQLA